MSVGTICRRLSFKVEGLEGPYELVSVDVSQVFNFGYTARDQRAVEAHLQRCAERGCSAPTTIPAVYPVAVEAATTAADIVVSGSATYGEVEYALVLAPDCRWLITVAADHSNATVEKIDVSLAKNMTPDVLAPRAWWLHEVQDRLDQLELRCEVLTVDNKRTVQQDTLATLLAPDELLSTLERRLSAKAAPGTIVLSGTIEGDPPLGAERWRITLTDPRSRRRLDHAYAVQALPAELPERSSRAGNELAPKRGRSVDARSPSAQGGSDGEAGKGGQVRYGPGDARRAPRYTGVRTFARCPNVRDPRNTDVAIVGVPFDTGTSYRVGARFGPEAVRSGSTLLRPYNANLKVDVFASQSVADYGDLEIVPGDAELSVANIAAGLEPLIRERVRPIVLGGDHTIALGELRAQAAVHGPIALVLFDAHVDTGDSYYGQLYFHGTPFRRAVEEGLVATESSTMLGMRGPQYNDNEWQTARDLGFEVVPCESLREMSAAEVGELVRDRVASRPAFLSFDIDIIDPGLAPGTGTPEAGGLMPYEALRFVRSLEGLDIRGFDVVEVSPQLDGPAGATALLAANVAYEFLGLSALAPALPAPPGGLTIRR